MPTLRLGEGGWHGPQSHALPLPEPCPSPLPVVAKLPGGSPSCRPVAMVSEGGGADSRGEVQKYAPAGPSLLTLFLRRHSLLECRPARALRGSRGQGGPEMGPRTLASPRRFTEPGLQILLGDRWSPSSSSLAGRFFPPSVPSHPWNVLPLASGPSSGFRSTAPPPRLSRGSPTSCTHPGHGSFLANAVAGL